MRSELFQLMSVSRLEILIAVHSGSGLMFYRACFFFSLPRSYQDIVLDTSGSRLYCTERDVGYEKSLVEVSSEPADPNPKTSTYVVSNSYLIF